MERAREERKSDPKTAPEFTPLAVAAKAPHPDRVLDGIPPDTRVVIAGVTWEFYASLISAVRNGASCRIAFDGKDIELMTVGPFHDLLKTYVDAFVGIVAEELAIDWQSVGSTTWKRKKIKRGVESDLCYYFYPAKINACCRVRRAAVEQRQAITRTRTSRSRLTCRRRRLTGRESTRR